MIGGLHIDVAGQALSETLKAELAACWMAVTNSGGAVGFPFPPVEIAVVAEAVDYLALEISSREVILFQARLDTALAGWVVLRLNTSPLTAHWATIERLQSHRAQRGLGVGSALLRAIVEHGAQLGLESLHLAVRGGQDLERFYEKRGWREIGRHPNALRLSDNDTRDEVFMAMRL